jgi:hypothetical protein
MLASLTVILDKVSPSLFAERADVCRLDCKLLSYSSATQAGQNYTSQTTGQNYNSANQSGQSSLYQEAVSNAYQGQSQPGSIYHQSGSSQTTSYQQQPSTNYGRDSQSGSFLEYKTLTWEGDCLVSMLASLTVILDKVSPSLFAERADVCRLDCKLLWSEFPPNGKKRY